MNDSSINLNEFSDDELRQELERRSASNTKPEPLPDIDWSGVRQNCIDYIDGIAKDGYGPKDIEHYIMEAAMEAVFGHEVWGWFNKYRGWKD